MFVCLFSCPFKIPFVYFEKDLLFWERGQGGSALTGTDFRCDIDEFLRYFLAYRLHYLVENEISVSKLSTP